MKKYVAVKAVAPAEDYKLILTFSNGEMRMFDMKPHLNKGIFKELRDAAMFNTVRVSFDTVEWDNEADFDPEVLYSQSEKLKGRKYFAANTFNTSTNESRAKYKKRTESR